MPNERNVSCGIASSIFNGNLTGDAQLVLNRDDKLFTFKSYEYGSERYTGDIVKTYQKGQIVNTTVHVRKFLWN